MNKHVDFLGLDCFDLISHFTDFIYDVEENIVVSTDAITHYDEKLGPLNNAINSNDLFEMGVCGYQTSASISDRLDGSGRGVIVLNSKNRRMAEEVHAEVLSALRNLYERGIEGDAASTTALKQVCDNSLHKDLLKFHQYDNPRA